MATGRMLPDGTHAIDSGQIEEFFEKYPDAAQYLVPPRSLREQQRAALKADAEWRRESMARQKEWEAEQRRLELLQVFRDLTRVDGVIELEQAAAFVYRYPEFKETLPLEQWAEFEVSIAALKRRHLRPDGTFYPGPGIRQFGTSLGEQLLRGTLSPAEPKP